MEVPFARVKSRCEREASLDAFDGSSHRSPIDSMRLGDGTLSEITQMRTDNRVISAFLRRVDSGRPRQHVTGSDHRQTSMIRTI